MHRDFHPWQIALRTWRVAACTVAVRLLKKQGGVERRCDFKVF
jgi:hypothetical protein